MTFDTDRFKAAIGAVVRELFPNLRFYGAYEYTVSKGEGAKFSGRPVRKTIGLPDLQDIPIRGPTIGGQSQLVLASGQSVVVMFVDGDPGRPFLAFADSGSSPTESGLKTTGRLHFEVGSLMEVNAAGDFVALAQKVLTELQTIQSNFNAHTHPTPWGPSGPPLAPMPAPNSVACTKLKTD
jgi:hypothetical protein